MIILLLTIKEMCIVTLMKILYKKLTLLIFYHFLSSTQMLVTYHYFVLLIWHFYSVKELSLFKDIKKIILTLILN